jgi:hypothetical protein
MTINPAIVNAVLADLHDDEPQLSKEQRRRLKTRTRSQARVVKVRAVQRCTADGEDDDDAA